MNKELENKAKHIVVMEYISEITDNRNTADIYDQIVNIPYDIDTDSAGDVIHDHTTYIVWEPHFYRTIYDVIESMMSLYESICATFEENFHEKD